MVGNGVAHPYGRGDHATFVVGSREVFDEAEPGRSLAMFAARATKRPPKVMAPVAVIDGHRDGDGP